MSMRSDNGWVEIKQYSVLINREGHIKSALTGRLLAHCQDRSGYPRVYLKQENGTRKGLFVHRLMALAFVLNPENRPNVNHIDGNKGNFDIHNLEWCTHSYNMKHARDTGLWRKDMSYRNHQDRNAVIMRLIKRNISRDVIQEAFDLKRPALNKIIRENLARNKATKEKA